MDAPGKREELHDMARRLAAAGYFVVLPNLYYRITREFRLVRDEDGMKRMFELMRSLSIEMVMRDTAAMFEFVDHQPVARPGALGVVGYCMSGPFVFAAAARYPMRVKCAASIYGAGLVTDKEDSPHLTAAKIRGEMYFACASTDTYAPPEVIEQLVKHLKTAGTNHRIEIYPDTHHGFAFPQRQGIYDHASAERHWERLFDLFERNLGHAL